MKKILTTLTLLITLCTYALGQYTNYFGEIIVDQSYMNIGRGAVYINGELMTNADYIEVAAFINDEVRGRKLGITDAFRSFPISGNSDLNGTDVIFKVYNHKTQELLTSTTVLKYQDKENLGSPSNPFVIEFVSASTFVAKINETEEYFSSLAAAVEAAEDNQTITLLKSTEGSGVVINKDVTIDFGGFTYTFTTPAVGSTGTTSNGFQILNGNTVTLQNGKLNVAVANKDEYYILIQNYANLNVTNMTLDGTNLDMWSTTDGDSYTLSNNSGNVNIINSTITANDEGSKAFAFDACKYASYTAPVVTVGNDVVISGKVEICGGQLVTENTNLSVVVKKEFNGGADWGTISVPVATASIPEATVGIHDLYRYDEPTATWQYYKDEVNGGNADNPFEKLELGQGYLYSNTQDIELLLEGTLNVADATVQLSYTESNALAGFNMVGNPFAYNIGLNNFVTEATLANGFYTIGAGGAWIAQTEGQEIAPMEAVLIKANMKATMTIKAAQQSEAKRNQSKAYLAINVANAEYNDVAYVSFSEGMGLDKISHRNADVPMVSVPVEGREYAIAIMNEDVTEIPVTFKASTMGEYTISVEAHNCEYAMMTLVDRLTGIETNLLIDDYTFVATSKDNADRFIIRLDNSQASTEDSSFAYINNGMININNIEGQGMINIYDVTGRSVAEYNVFESANISTSDFTSGMYIVRMTDENGIKVQKIIIE